MAGMGNSALATGVNVLYVFGRFFRQFNRSLTALALLSPGLVFAQAQMSTPGAFAVSPSGAATYSIPIQVPPGTAGMQPSLALSYNSQAGNALAGMGWSLSGLSAIHRCPATIVQGDGYMGGVNYDANDRFCLDGERLIVVNGFANGASGAEYRTEHESFSRVKSFGACGGGPCNWTVEAKSGQTIEFGNTEDSRVQAATQPRGIARAEIRMWALNKVSDRAGNYLTVSYYEDQVNGIHVPVWIAYSGNTNTGQVPYAVVQPVWQARPDIDTAFEAGSQIQTVHRLSHVNTFTSPGAATFVKMYFLTYDAAPSPSTNRSRLASVQECADTARTNCLNPTNITWQGSEGFDAQREFGNGNNWHDATARGFEDFNADGLVDFWYVPSNTATVYVRINTGGVLGPASIWAGGLNWWGSNLKWKGFADVNGDGKPDLWYASPGNTLYVRLNNGFGFDAVTVWASAIPWSGTGDWHGVGPDFNADGLADFWYVRDGTAEVWVALSTRAGFTAPTLWAGGANWFGSSFKWKGFADVNRDGKPDLWYASPGNTLYVRLNTGSGFGAAAPWASAIPWSGTGDWHGVGPDFNADGLADFWYVRDNTAEVWVGLSTGTSFTAPTLWAGGLNWWGSSYKWKGFADVNGDSKPDLWYASPGNTLYVRLNVGSGFGAAAAWASAIPWSGTGDWHGVGEDFNGDGKSDFWYVTNNTTQIMINPTRGGGVDLSTSITNGLGAQITISHKPLTDSSVYSKGVSAGSPYLDVQAPIYVVSNTSSSNGVGGTRDLRYFYYSAIARREGGGMMGFAAMQVYDDLTSTIQTSWSRTDWPYQGFVYASQSQTYAGVLLSRTDSNLAAQLTYPGVYFSYASSTTDQVYVANNGVTDKTLINTVTTTNEFTEFPQYGNPKKITVTDTAGYAKTSVNNYDNDAVNWKLGRLTCAAVTNSMPSGATQTRTSGFSYNAAGFLETETVEPGITCPGATGAASSDANLRLTTTYSYDSYGNKQSGTVSGGVSTNNSYVAPRTTYTYFEAQGNNPAGRFPTRVVNTLGHTETHEFDPRFGAMTKLTGPNNVATSWAYDAFGRKSSETRADGTSSTWNYAYYAVAGNAYHIITSTTGAPYTDTYFDILNRSTRSYVTHFDGVRSAGSGVDYDSLGRVAIRYRNFLSDATVFPRTFVSYDILGRVTAETGPDGSTATFSYNGLSSTVTRSTGRGAPGSIASTTVVNTQGQKVSVTDAANTITSYAYDAFGNLLSTNAIGVVTTMAYNLRGFKTSMNDPDMGVWSYQYSALGELKQQTDAKLQVTTMTYDILGRLTNRSEPSLISNWYYDAYKGGGACVGGKGKLCQVESNNGYNRTYTYDTLGRATEVAYTIDDLVNPYRISTSYGVAGDTVCPNSQGKVCTVTYPAATVSGVTSRFAVRNEYNATGYLSKIWRHDLALTKPYWTGTAMNADGNFTGDSMGTSAADLTTVRTFDPLTGRLKEIKAGLNGASAAQFNRYVYDHLGNVTERHDDNMNVHETFTLDALSRLTQMSMTGTTAQTKTYQYNAIGNLTYKSDLGTLTYPAIGSPRPHGVTSIAGNATGVLDGVTNGAYTYDANGNMASSVQVNRIYTYTSFNLPSRIFNSNSTSDFIYDADHNRISESYVNGTIIYVNPGNVTFFERHKNFNQAGYEIYRFFVHTPSGATIFFSRQSNNGAQAVRFQLKDNLGSTVADVDATGNVVTRYSFDAFGKVRNPNGSATGGTLSQSRRGFTGHEHISVGNSGLIHMNGRVYDATLGRFITADPQVQFAGFSQSYNRYSYGFNNPLSGTDPSGFGWFSDFISAAHDSFKNPTDIRKSYYAFSKRPDGGAQDRFMMNHSWARSLSKVAAATIPFAGWAVSAYLSGYDVYLQGGGQKDIKRAWLISIGSAAASYGVGSATESISASYGDLAGAAFNVVGHAAVGCAASSAGGGSCGAGAAAGAAGPLILGPNQSPTGNFAADLVISMIVGGIASELVGGNFEDGAVTSAFGYIYNSAKHLKKRSDTRSSVDQTTENSDIQHDPNTRATNGASDSALTTDFPEEKNFWGNNLSNDNIVVAAGKSPVFKCVTCGAPHGGLFGPYCPSCYQKSLDPKGGVPPLWTPIKPGQ